MVNSNKYNSKSDGNHSRVKNIIATLVLVIVTIIFLIMAAATVGELSHINYERTTYTAKELLRLIERGDYAYLLEHVTQNRASGVDGEEYTDIYAVTDYYQAAVLFYAYDRTGDVSRAGEYRKEMDESKKLMGSLEYAADEIDRLVKPE